MEMFDTIRVNADKLPVSEEERKLLIGQNFQTEDLDNTASVYRITDDGVLEECIYIWEEIPPKELALLPQEKTTKNKKFFDTNAPLNSHLRKKEIGWDVVEDIHQDILFYADINPPKSNRYDVIQFKARFSYGRLDSIKRFESTKYF